MQLRLVHTLSLMMAAAILAAVLAFGGLLAWSLHSGFNNYMSERDDQTLERFAASLASRVQSLGGIASLRDERVTLNGLLDDFARESGVQPRPGSEAQTRTQGPPRGLKPFGPIIGIYAPDGTLVLGSPIQQDGTGVKIRPIVVQGVEVGQVRMPAMPEVPEGIEAQFMRSQLWGIALISCAMMAAGLLGARWLAGHLARPLLDIQAAATRIASGDFSMRMASQRSDEIGDLIRDVNSMAEGLQRLEQTRRRLIADVAHELRTPLTVLRGELDALAEGVRELSMAAVTSLREEALRLSRVVSDLHLLAMADIDALPCYFGECDPFQLARQVVARLQARAGECGLTLEFLAGDSESARVHWDAQRVGQLLSNLLENSLRYTDSPGRITLSVRAEGDRILLNVQDTPPGVPVRYLSRLFDPLYRTDSARNREHGGSGLGLAICAAIARAHGGTVAATSSALGGLSVLVDLPMSGPAPT